MKNTLSLLIILILLIFPFYLFAQSPLALNDNVKTDILKDFFGSLSDKERGKLLKDLRNEFGKEFEDISGVERFRPGERPLDQNKITKPDKEKQVLSQKEKSKSTDINDLKVFGHSLFNKNISTFSPVDDAVPRDNYKLGPGDEIVFYLSGSEEDTRSVTVNRDGNMMFPLIGTVNVA